MSTGIDGAGGGSMVAMSTMVMMLWVDAWGGEYEELVTGHRDVSFSVVL